MINCTVSKTSYLKGGEMEINLAWNSRLSKQYGDKHNDYYVIKFSQFLIINALRLVVV